MVYAVDVMIALIHFFLIRNNEYKCKKLYFTVQI